MPANIDLLDSDFKIKYEQLQSNCEIEGWTIVPYFTLRTPFTQAKLWRQSRSTSEINRAISYLIAKDALWLSDVLKNVGSQYGRWVTNALPGQSWHQFGKAVDSYVLYEGRAIWNPKNKTTGAPEIGYQGYKVMAEKAQSLRLTSGIGWNDAVHVQSNSHSSVTRTLSWSEIDKEMQDKFGKD